MTQTEREIEQVRKDTAEKTRDVYLEQHNIYLKDDVTFDRFVKMVSDISYFHLPEGALKEARILDAGCGNTAYFQVAMHRFGVSHQTCLELGDEWVDPLKTKLQEQDIPLENFTFVSGSTDDLPFSDGEFDYVFSNGVLPHLNDVEQAEKAFKELSRVTKKGGSLYIILGAAGGLFEEKLFEAVREYYRENDLFKTFIDNISPDTFQTIFAQIADGMQKYTGESFNYTKIAKLFDWDFCAFVQNVTQVPTRLCLELDENWTREQFKLNGFDEPKRCRRYVVRKNIRKYEAPLHYNSDLTISKILYGDGNMEWIAQKV